MWAVLLRVIRNYAPVVTLPFAAIIGVIGYNLENILSDKHTPSLKSVKERREERFLNESKEEESSLKEHSFVPKTVFEKNLSPSLQDAENTKSKNK